MKKLLFALMVGAAAFSLGVSGCQDTYPPEMRYGLRTDPLVSANQEAKLGEETFEPEPPGRLPILRASEVNQPESPYYPKRDIVFQQEVLRDPTLVPAAARATIEQTLLELFGTPAAPKVGELNDAQRKLLKLDDVTLKEGSELYRIHCVHCHGVPGDGRGPTARWIHPHPRDFRQGLFKFLSVDQTNIAKRPPHRDDLLRTLRSGIEGTAMPPFLILPAQQLEALASYVTHLSMRGRAEYETIGGPVFKFDRTTNSLAVGKTDEGTDEDVGQAIKDYHSANVQSWVLAQEPKAAIVVPAYDLKANKKDPKSADAGEWQVWKDLGDTDRMKLKAAIALAHFNGDEPADPKVKEILKLRGESPKEVNCRQCHTDYGRQAKFRFDQWGTLVRPNNFTSGVFRGGRRKVDLYYRVHSGINGSGMAAFGKTISTNSIWELVDFVHALSYPGMRTSLGIRID